MTELTETQKMLAQFDQETLSRLVKMAENDKRKQDARENANPKFIQVNKANLPAVAFLSAENGLAAGIYFFLTERMTLHNAVACSYTVFQEYFGASRTSVYNAVKLLKDKQFFKVAKMGNTNVYYLNDQIVWQKGAKEREYAEFSATVVLSKSEQEKHDKAKKSMIKLNALPTGTSEQKGGE